MINKEWRSIEDIIEQGVREQFKSKCHQTFDSILLLLDDVYHNSEIQVKILALLGDFYDEGINGEISKAMHRAAYEVLYPKET